MMMVMMTTKMILADISRCVFHNTNYPYRRGARNPNIPSANSLQIARCRSHH